RPGWPRPSPPGRRPRSTSVRPVTSPSRCVRTTTRNWPPAGPTPTRSAPTTASGPDVRGVSITEPGEADVLRATDVEAPTAQPGQVVIDTVAAGVNRADVMQRKGFYPPPKGASPLPGLEVSGVIASVGPDVQAWSVGGAVCALVDGGGYAAQGLAPAAHLLPVPTGVSVRDAAGLPDVACTVWSNVFMTATL